MIHSTKIHNTEYKRQDSTLDLRQGLHSNDLIHDALLFPKILFTKAQIKFWVLLGGRENQNRSHPQPRRGGEGIMKERQIYGKYVCCKTEKNSKANWAHKKRVSKYSNE